MSTIEEVLGEREQPALVLRPPVPGEYGWVIQRHGALYAREYGFDASFEALAAQIVAEFAQRHDPTREQAWIAALDGEPVGSIFCVDAGDGVAKLRLLIVDPAARGRRVGKYLVDECIRFARAAGYRELTLWTQSQLEAARRIYTHAGFELIESEPRRCNSADERLGDLAAHAQTPAKWHAPRVPLDLHSRRRPADLSIF